MMFPQVLNFNVTVYKMNVSKMFYVDVNMISKHQLSSIVVYNILNTVFSNAFTAGQYDHGLSQTSCLYSEL